MRFAVSRTSIFNEEEKPIEECFEAEYTLVDIRSVDDPVKIPIYGNDRDVANKDWYGKGTNHRLINNCIARDLGKEKGWFVEIKSLEDLIKFYKKYGRLIIQSKEGAEGVIEIEIYDDYRE